jgi:glutamate/tyrosine decarboxylase-like PLP-dependent enzyme
VDEPDERDDPEPREHPAFPRKGRPADALIEEIRSRRGDDADWRSGRTFSLVYNPSDPELERLQQAVALEYLHENYLNPFAFPSLLQMEREVVAMAADLVHGDPRAGKLTSGGTESLFLAVQVARDHARRQRGIAEPAAVLPGTAHPALSKACHYLDVEEVRVPVGPDGSTASPRCRPTSTSTAGASRARRCCCTGTRVCSATSTSSSTAGRAGCTARPPRPGPGPPLRSPPPGQR